MVELSFVLAERPLIDLITLRAIIKYKRERE